MNNNSKKRIIAAGLAVMICTTGIVAGAKLVKNSPYEGKNITTISYSEETTMDDITTSYSYKEQSNVQNVENKSTIYETTPPYNSSQVEEKEDDFDYDELKQQLVKIIREKNFNNEICECLNKMFDRINNNYDTLDEIYKDKNRLSKEEYLKEILNTLSNNVDSIYCVDKDDIRDILLVKELGDVLGKYIPSDDKILLASGLDDDLSQQILLHEIFHSSQNEFNICPELDDGMQYILKEGEASYSSTNLYSTIPFNSKTVFELGEINYALTGPSSAYNAVYAKYYYMLGTLAGFDVMNESKNNYDESTIINAIESNYDIDGSKLFNDMNDTVEELLNNFNSDKMFNGMFSIEKMYLHALKQDIVKISSKNEALDMLNKYRYYKLQYSILSYDDNWNYMDKMNYSEVENMLFEKTIEYEALPENVEKPVFDMLLNKLDNPNMNSEKEVSIYNISYSIDKEKIILTGKNNQISEVYNLSTKEFEKCMNSSNDVYTSGIPIVNNICNVKER